MSSATRVPTTVVAAWSSYTTSLSLPHAEHHRPFCEISVIRGFSAAVGRADGDGQVLCTSVRLTPRLPGMVRSISSNKRALVGVLQKVTIQLRRPTRSW